MLSAPVARQRRDVAEEAKVCEGARKGWRYILLVCCRRAVLVLIREVVWQCTDAEKARVAFLSAASELKRGGGGAVAPKGAAENCRKETKLVGCILI